MMTERAPARSVPNASPPSGGTPHASCFRSLRCMPVRAHCGAPSNGEHFLLRLKKAGDN